MRPRGAGKHMMTGFGRRGLGNRWRDHKHRTSRWPALAAFIAGVVFTAALAQIFVHTGNASSQEQNVPAPRVAPGLTSELAELLPGEGPELPQQEAG